MAKSDRIKISYMFSLQFLCSLHVSSKDFRSLSKSYFLGTWSFVPWEGALYLSTCAVIKLVASMPSHSLTNQLIACIVVYFMKFRDFPVKIWHHFNDLMLASFLLIWARICLPLRERGVLRENVQTHQATGTSFAVKNTWQGIIALEFRIKPI